MTEHEVYIRLYGADCFKSVPHYRKQAAKMHLDVMREVMEDRDQDWCDR